MATVNDALGDGQALFVEDKASSTPSSTDRLGVGEYKGHITDITMRDVDTHGGKHKATVYNGWFTVASENGTCQGKRIKMAGTFKYHEPKEGDSFEANPSFNKKYTYFCETIGVVLKAEEREIDGQTVTVKILPTLSEDDIIGRALTAVVGEGQDWTNQEGKTLKGYEVKFCKRWAEGTNLDVKKSDALNRATINKDTNEMPF